jgi:hypothetical protein
MKEERRTEREREREKEGKFPTNIHVNKIYASVRHRKKICKAMRSAIKINIEK